MKEEYEFDFDEILDEFRSGKKLTDKGGLLAPLIKQLTEAALEAEVESHIVNDVLSGTRTDVTVPIEKLSKVPSLVPLNLRLLKNTKLPYLMR